MFDQYFNSNLVLETEKVILRPLLLQDLEAFAALAHSEVLWKYFSKDLKDEEQRKEWVSQAIEERNEKKRFPFTIVEKASRRVCGSTSFGNISFFDQRIEVGWTWLGEEFLGSGINSHCKFALLRYAFETMRFQRVEIKTDNLNERAKHALRKIGATEEGVLRSHMLMPGNRRRDSVYFSVLLNEWPRVKQFNFVGIK